MCAPKAISAAPDDGVYIADGNRVVYQALGNATKYPAATRVYGQPDMTHNQPPSAASASTLQDVAGIVAAVDGSLYIADSSTNRVLYYAPGAIVATRVYGQPDMTTATINTGGLSATSLNNPTGLAFDSQANLYVADTGNNRVVVYPAWHNGDPTSAIAATQVYGQSDMMHGCANSCDTQAASALSLHEPRGLSIGLDGGLYVADKSNNRILYFAPGTVAASRVYGQNDYTSTRTYGANPFWLKGPEGVSVAPDGWIYASDGGHHRVLKFAPWQSGDDTTFIRADGIV